MLPKAVLRPAPRGGALRRQQAGQFTLRRCGRWLGGEREELLEAHARGRRAAHAPEDSEDPVVRAGIAAAALWQAKGNCPVPVHPL